MLCLRSALPPWVRTSCGGGSSPHFLKHTHGKVRVFFVIVASNKTGRHRAEALKQVAALQFAGKDFVVDLVGSAPRRGARGGRRVQRGQVRARASSRASSCSMRSADQSGWRRAKPARRVCRAVRRRPLATSHFSAADMVLSRCAWMGCRGSRVIETHYFPPAPGGGQVYALLALAAAGLGAHVLRRRRK